MKLPEISKPAGLSTTGLTGIVLMTLHITENFSLDFEKIMKIFRKKNILFSRSTRQKIFRQQKKT